MWLLKGILGKVTAEETEEKGGHQATKGQHLLEGPEHQGLCRLLI